MEEYFSLNSKPFDLIMALNFFLRKIKLGCMTMEFFIKEVALQPPNKTALLNGNIVIYSMLLALYDFKLVYHSLFEENAFLQQFYHQ